MIYLAPLIGIIGAYLYHLRGGGYFRKGKSTLLNRLIFVIPTSIVVYFLLPLWSSIAFLITLFITISLGHGLFMDMGRWKPSYNQKAKSYKEHEKPITWLIGPEDYRWSFWKSWLHNFIGMSLVGLMRHAPVWTLYGQINIPYLVAYTLLGLSHSILYELGHQTGRVLNYFDRHEYTAYGEHYVGFVMLTGLWIILWM